MEKKSKILIVDDAMDTVELLKKRFRSEGYDTAEAYNGEEALNKVPEYDPDLIVLDVMMPKIDGYQVCQRLKADEKTKYIPILMLTAKGEVEHKVKGLDIGADDYMSKPFDYKELSARVRSLLSIKATHKKKVEEEKTGALEQMMDQVAHEIRNPLTSIGGFARKVFTRLPEGDPNKKYMQMIIEDVAVLESMIKQLIELKSLSISMKEPSNINDVIKDSLKVFEQDVIQKAVNVETDLKDNLPLITVDKKLLKRAFCNLIKNSIEAMETGTKVLKIISRLSGDNLELQFSDTGKGISKDKIKNIFDPLVTSKVYGPGLGLTFALKIIQDHKGTISVESESGKGTTFTIRLPVKKP
ncbi:MAG: response regulator [Thermodesulfovibrionales bacterium]|nr:response regulator [Nitrospinota bacterium]MDP3049672.1 response regulator [Thermodesulfovibrionales bacterium]